MEDEKLLTLLLDIQKSLAEIQTNQVVSTSRWTSVEEKVNELYRTVQGYNGNPGMVTDLALLRADVRNIDIEPIVHDLGVLKSAVTALQTNANTGNTGKILGSSSKEDSGGSDKVTYVWLLEKVVAPIIQPAVAAIILYILFNVIPHVTTGGTP